MSPIRIEVAGELGDRYDEILSPGALEFLTWLHDRFQDRRRLRLLDRGIVAHGLAQGRPLRFRPETREVRENPDWRVAPPAPGLLDRRVEITGPTDRKMAVNALNSGAKVWLADHEDALSPTWANLVEGQITLYDAIRGRLDYTSPEGKEYRVTAESPPTIVFRPRGWHLEEKQLRYTDRERRSAPASGTLVDFGLYAYHNARELIDRGSGPYFYLPKTESYLEARLWDQIFTFTENALSLPHGAIRATVLIETIPAAFEMEEILYELRDHCAGLNAGRWDYLFSIIKTLGPVGPQNLLPDRSQITMTVPFMRAYTELLVTTCHRRGAHAIGGMSAFIPNRRDPEVTRNALEKVAADKAREAGDGFDGSWVAHPDLVEIARAEFDAVLGGRPNQLDRRREQPRITAEQLLDFRIPGSVTAEGLRTNVSAALRYIESWLRGVGAAAIDNLMEDAATAEISRSQLWQWIRWGARTEDGAPVTRERVEALIAAEAADLQQHGARFAEAADLLRRVALQDELPPFLTIPAYDDYLVEAPSLQPG